MSLFFCLIAIAIVASVVCAALCPQEIEAVAESTVPKVYVVTPEPEEEDYQMTPEEIELEHYYDSLELLAICVMAEAEGESELGKRLVIDTILNRVDHPEFPDNIWDVITVPYAFTSYWNGRMDRVEPTTEIFRLVTEELESRTNNQVLYFNSEKWPDYGNPILREGNHYFSG